MWVTSILQVSFLLSYSQTKLRFRNSTQSLYAALSLFWLCSMWVKMSLHSCLQVLSRLPILIAWLSKQPGKVFISTLRQKNTLSLSIKGSPTTMSIRPALPPEQLLWPAGVYNHNAIRSYTAHVYNVGDDYMTIGEPQVRSQRWPQPCLNPWQPCRSADHLDFRSTCFLVGFFLCPRPEHHL